MKDAKEMLKAGLQDFQMRCELEPWKDEHKCFWLLEVLRKLRSIERGKQVSRPDRRTRLNAIS